MTSDLHAAQRTVEETEPRVSVVGAGAGQKYADLRAAQKPSKDGLVSNMSVGIINGMETNPLLDATKKAGWYIQENLDANFKYPIAKFAPGDLNTKFGFNVANVTYYRTTDINTFDGNLYAKLEQALGKNWVADVGYNCELLWFPNDEYGTYVGHEVNTSLRQKMTERLYQKVTYRYIQRNYTDRKALLGWGGKSSDLRQDRRNLIEHELGIYIGKKAKLRITNQYYQNNSNYLYQDYYDYWVYRPGGSLVYMFTKKCYGVGSFYYYRKEYDERKVSDRDAKQKDNLYLISGSLMYDLTKNVSMVLTYTFRENHTNEVLEQYSDSIYTAGMYYSF